MEWGSLLPVGGLAVAAGFIAASWGTIRSIGSQLVSRVIGTITVSGPLVDAVGYYCWNHYKASKFGPRKYFGWFVWVRKLTRTQLVALEDGKNNRLFWNGLRPLWLRKQDNEDDRNNISRQHGNPNGMTITYLRGTLDPDAFLETVCDEYNKVRVIYDPHESDKKRRHYIRVITGTGDRQMVSETPDVPTAESNVQVHDDVQWGAASHRIIGYELDEIGQQRDENCPSLSLLSIPSEANKWVEDIDRWLQSEKWYREHHVPWRRGVGLHGPPGTGKTSLVRAIAEDLDLPLFSYDLRTLRNGEIIRHWHEMLSNTPCIALIEDIDAVFKGRENIAESGSLSFDCLLNCIDGVRRSDGVLLAVTTNNVETLDPALTRNGRLDQMLELGPLPKELRQGIADRILAGFPVLVAEAVEKTDGAVGATVQEVCCQMALDRFWSDRDQTEFDR